MAGLQDPVGALSPNGADPAFGDRINVMMSSPRRALDNCPHTCGEIAAILNQCGLTHWDPGGHSAR